MRADDIPGVVRLQRLCFPAPFPEDLLWTAEQLERHLAIFREGQFVALDDDGSVVGSASNTLLAEAKWLAHEPWALAVGGPFFESYDPNGNTLYGADISVEPGWRRVGVGRALYDARFGLVRRRGLARYGTACRIPGYSKWRARTAESAESYVRAVVDRRTIDRTLTPLLQYGLRCLGVVDHYMKDDESGDAAALLEWLP